MIVEPDSGQELLFRYACLHWSIPVSAGYRRRLRFLVIDESNDKLIGLFSLGDPVYAIQARDRWIGWDREDRETLRKRFLQSGIVTSESTLGYTPPCPRPVRPMGPMPSSAS